MRRLRIALVELSPSGGLFQFALQLGEALECAGHSVDLVTGKDPELRSRVPSMTLSAILPTWHPGAPGVERFALRKVRRVARAARYLEAWRRVAVHIHRRPVDAVVWSDWRFPVDALFVAWIARRRRGAALALVAHEPRPLGEQRTSGSLYISGAPLLLRRWTLGAAYRRMDVVFVLAEQSRRDLVATWPQVRRVVTIPHGDEGIFASGPVATPDACPPRVLFFGVLTRYKGLDMLLDAFAAVRSRMPEAELVVAGAVSGDIDYPALARRAGAIGGVSMRPGYVAANDVAALMGASRVVAAPYVRATQSGVVHLAQTFGRPVVATAVGDLPAVVRDAEAGLLTPPGDAQAFAEALERLLRNPLEAARMGRRGRQRLEAKSSWDLVAAQVADALGQACTAAAAGRPTR